MSTTGPDWFPVATLLLGFGAKVIGDFFNDGRALKRELAIHKAQRQLERETRRDDLQRETMLNLQETIVEIMRKTSTTFFHHVKEARAGTEWKAIRLPTDLNENLTSLQKQLSLLESRIADAVIREATERVRQLCWQTALAPDEQTMKALLQQAGSIADPLLNRIGAGIRMIDGWPEGGPIPGTAPPVTSA